MCKQCVPLKGPGDEGNTCLNLNLVVSALCLVLSWNASKAGCLGFGFGFNQINMLHHSTRKFNGLFLYSCIMSQ